MAGSIGIDHPLLQEVLTIAEEFLNQNKAFDAKKLYSLAKRRLNIHRRTLLEIIEFLLEQKILVEGSKLTKDLVLLNNYRRVIYDFIKNNIGVNFSLIKNKVYSSMEDYSGSSGQFIWHLQMLLKFEYIKKIKFKKFTLFIPFEVSTELAILHFLLRDDINHAIVKLIINEDPIKKSDIFKVLNENRDSIYYHLNILMESNVIIHYKTNSQELSIEPEKKPVLLNVLNKIETTTKG